MAHQAPFIPAHGAAVYSHPTPPRALWGFDKLVYTGKNYKVWCRHAEAALQGSNLWEVTAGRFVEINAETIVVPEIPAVVNQQGVVTAQAVPATHPSAFKISMWTGQNNTALALLIESFDQIMTVETDKQTTARSLWTHVINKFEPAETN